MSLNLPDGEAWAKAQDPDDPTNWVILSFNEGSKTDMTAATGTGGLAEFCATLKDDAIHYGAFVIYGVDERGNVTSRREKFVQVTWVGENVKVMAKSKVAGQRSAAMAYFSGYHIAYQIMDGDRDDISEAELEKKLLQVGGAHKPKFYDFGGTSGDAAKAAGAGGGENKDDDAAGALAEASAAAAAADAEKRRFNEEQEKERNAALAVDLANAEQARAEAEAKEAADAAAFNAKQEQERNAATAADLADTEQARVEAEAKEAEEAAAFNEAQEQERNAATAAELADTEQERRVEENKEADEAAAFNEKQEQERNAEVAADLADTEQERRVEEGPNPETVQRARKLSVEVAAAVAAPTE